MVQGVKDLGLDGVEVAELVQGLETVGKTNVNSVQSWARRTQKMQLAHPVACRLNYLLTEFHTPI